MTEVSWRWAPVEVNSWEVFNQGFKSKLMQGLISQRSSFIKSGVRC